MCMYVRYIAGQTAGPSWLTFFKEPMGTPGADNGLIGYDIYDI